MRVMRTTSVCGAASCTLSVVSALVTTARVAASGDHVDWVTALGKRVS